MTRRGHWRKRGHRRSGRPLRKSRCGARRQFAESGFDATCSLVFSKGRCADRPCVDPDGGEGHGRHRNGWITGANGTTRRRFNAQGGAAVVLSRRSDLARDAAAQKLALLASGPCLTPSAIRPASGICLNWAWSIGLAERPGRSLCSGRVPNGPISVTAATNGGGWEDGFLANIGTSGA